MVILCVGVGNGYPVYRDGQWVSCVLVWTIGILCVGVENGYPVCRCGKWVSCV